MRSLLLLDDDQAVCDALTRLLVQQGVDVEGCTRPDAFMALARTRSHRALLVDWNLKVCEGTSLIQKLRDEDDLRPIGLMSANVTAAHGDELAQEAGADAYIDKTLDMKVFVAAVRALLELAEGTSSAAPAPSGRGQPVRSSGTALRAQRAGYCTTIELRGDLVLVHDHLIELRAKEHAVLRCLIANAGSIVSAEILAREVWGLAAAPTTTIIKTTVSRLRDHLGTAGALIERADAGYLIRLVHARLRQGHV